MRRGMGQSIIMKDDQFIGFCLGSDHCYEHEHGVDGLISLFKIEIGEDRSTGVVTKVPEKNIILTEPKETSTEYVFLMANRYANSSDKINYWFLNVNELISHNLESMGFTTAWDKESFGILVKKEHRKYLDELYAAFLNKDISFSMGNDVCDKSGLKIYITSKVK